MSLINQRWFSQIKRPSRYLGGEINAIKKDPAKVEVSIALVFPDVYEVGMSHLGLKILYHILNQVDWLAAERAFSPWVDLEKELRARRIPPAALESGRPLRSFDIVGFSLQYELSFTNVLNMLDLSGIPFLASERDDSFPLILAGGPACFNPEPIAPFFDAIVIGDGEETTLEICKRVKDKKLQKARGKEDFLSELTEIEGVYVPAFFDVRYGPDGTICNLEPTREGYGEIKKAIIPDIDRYPLPTHQVVPFTELIHDRLAIEIARGCTRGCRFCQAGMIYRPVRERSPDSVIRNVEEALRNTGFEELSLLSLSSGDYCCLGLLIKELMDKQAKNKVAISLPSLRVDSMDPLWIAQIKRVRKTGFTLAPETGSDRLRKAINKELTNQDILQTAREVYGAGWNLIKLYFMIGLPGETDGDLWDIVHLAREVSGLAKKGKKPKLNVSVSTFVPKAHTPFMWAPQISLEESHRRLKLLRNALKNSRVRVKWNLPEQSWLEGVFARGDRKLSRALIEAWRLGARYDAWTEHFNINLWEEAFKRSGIDPAFYLYRPRSTEEILPWDHIQSGVSRSYLVKEWKKAQEGEPTPDCREKCHRCGVCDHRPVAPLFYRDWTPSAGREKTFSNPPAAKIKKYRLTFSKTGSAGYLSHLEVVRLFIRAFKRIGVNFVYSQGYHPMPKVSFAAALPVGTESIDETVDIALYEPAPILSMKEGMNRQLPDGIEVSSIEDVTHKKKGPLLKESHFHIGTNGLEVDRADLDNFLQSDYFPINKKRKNGDRIINARAVVKSMNLIPSRGIDLVISHTSGPELKPIDIVKGVFHLEDSHVQGVKILKTKQVF